MKRSNKEIEEEEDDEREVKKKKIHFLDFLGLMMKLGVESDEFSGFV
jgi:hypothetical protein